MPDPGEKFEKAESGGVTPAREAHSLASGQLVAGKYKIISMLGAGGMGSVYRVEQVLLNKVFALKTLEQRRMSDTAVRRFQMEAKAAFMLNHPNLVQVHDFGLLDDDQPYLVMDFVDGMTLADMLKRDGPMSVSTASKVFAQVCFGLAYAHEQGVVHRDIKPSNIMLVNGAPIGAEGSVRVVDFGLAKLTASDDGEIQALTRTGEIFGSPLYMSPEQCTSGLVDHRSDIYSLGCVLFEALTGAPPHMGQTALTTMMMHQSDQALTLKEASLGKDFPPALERIVARMLSKSAHDRYQNLGVVSLDLAAVTKDEPAGKETGRKDAFSETRRVAPKTQPTKPDTAGTISMSWTRLLTLLTVFSLASAVIGAMFVDFTGKGANQAKIEGPAGKPDVIASTQVGDKRVFIFPKESIGRLTWNGGLPPNRAPAENRVEVPAGVPLFFEVDTMDAPAYRQNPQILAEINPPEFTGLRINGLELLDLPVTCNLLGIAGHWPNLNYLALNAVPGDEKVLSKLNGLRSLNELALEELQNFDAAALVRQPILNNLESLRFRGVTVDPAIKTLVQEHKKAYNLHRLNLENTSILPETVRALQIACPALVSLDIAQDQVSDELVQAAASLKQIRSIHFRCHLSRKQLDILLKSPTQARIEINKSFYNKAEIEELTKPDPRLFVWD